MLRSLLAAALATTAALCSLDVHAQNNVLYGLIDASASRSRPPGGDYRWQLDSGNMSRTFLGFRGTEDLGGGLRAVYRLESYFAIDSGAIGGYGGNAFWGRDANVGLSGAFGSTVLGRNVSPLYLTTSTFNPFGESFGFSPSTRQYFAGAVLGDRSWNNSVAYINNPRDPLRVHIVANAREFNNGVLDNGHNYGASVSYLSGPLAVAVAWEKIQNSVLPLPAGFDQQTVTQVSATYDFKLVRLYGQLGRVHTDAAINTKHTLFQIGAAVPIGQALILVAYGNSRAKTDFSQITNRTYSIGYDYFVSKNLDLYVAALHEKTFELSSGSTFAGGIRLRF
ncbi:MAG: porin [Caldimonas sp.]